MIKILVDTNYIDSGDCNFAQCEVSPNDGPVIRPTSNSLQQECLRARQSSRQCSDRDTESGDVRWRSKFANLCDNDTRKLPSNSSANRSAYCAENSYYIYTCIDRLTCWQNICCYSWGRASRQGEPL